MHALSLVFVLAVAAVSGLAGGEGFPGARRPGAGTAGRARRRPYPLRQKVIASSETSGRFGKVACDESVVGEDDRSGDEFGCVHRFEGSDGC